jgi:hypothetical protein
MLAVVAFLALPMSAFAQDNRRGRDDRDDRDDNVQRDRARDGIRNIDELRRRQAAAEAQHQRDLEAARRQREEAARRQREIDARRNNQGNDDWRRHNQGNDDWRRRNDDNERNRRGRDWGGYGSYGGTSQMRQTALNAGYNNGIQEGRKDRSRGDRFDYRDEGDYQSATEDYNSRFGNRELYRRYFREGFANGYRDGYNGY